MVARLPDNEAFMPLRIFRSRANQLAEEPESEVKMQSSGRRDESSQNTRSGFTGSALFMARAFIIFHQRSTSLIILFCQSLSSFFCKRGSNARKVLRLSPCKFRFVG